MEYTAKLKDAAAIHSKKEYIRIHSTKKQKMYFTILRMQVEEQESLSEISHDYLSFNNRRHVR